MATLQERIADLIAAIGADVKSLREAGVLADPWEYVVLGSTASSTSTTLANVTGMSFVAEASTVYEVELLGAFQSAATTTGIALALDVPSGTVVGGGRHNTSATAVSGWEQIADAATTGATTGVRAASTNVALRAKWLVSISSTGGTVQLQLKSEVGSSAVTLQAGLVLKYRKVGNQSSPGRIVPMTQAAYDALPAKDASALYVIVASPATSPSWRWVALTSTEYAAIVTPDPTTLYVIED